MGDETVTVLRLEVARTAWSDNGCLTLSRSDLEVCAYFQFRDHVI
jgi:hypothetical protein